MRLVVSTSSSTPYPFFPMHLYFAKTTTKLSIFFPDVLNTESPFHTSILTVRGLKLNLFHILSLASLEAMVMIVSNTDLLFRSSIQLSQEYFNESISSVP